MTANSSWNKYVFRVLGITYILTCLLASYVLWIRRSRHPVKARKPNIILVFNLFVSLVIAVVSCAHRSFDDPIPCVFVNTYLTVFYFSSFVVRAFSLWFRFEIAYESLQSYQGKDNANRRFWFSDHSYLVSDFALAMYLVIVFCYLAICAIVDGLQGACYDVRESEVIATVNNFILFACVLFLGYKLKKEHDHFWIKKELMFQAIVSGCVLATWFIILRTIRVFNNNVFSVSTLLAMIGYFLSLCFSSIYPAYLTKKFESRFVKVHSEHSELSPTNSQPVARSQVPDYEDAFILTEILKDPETCLYLQKFLIQELSLENLSFCKAYDSLQAMIEVCIDEKKPKEVLDLVELIHNDFVDLNGPFQVNLSSTARDQVSNDLPLLRKYYLDGDWEQFWAMSKEIYSNCQYEAMNLILTDSFVRFKWSEEGKKVICTKKESNAFRNARLISVTDSLVPTAV